MKTKPRKRKLTEVEMRVAIARDVLTQLKLKLLTPTMGTYMGLNYDSPLNDVPFGTDAQPILLMKKRKPCAACAIGAGIIALIRLEDNYNVGDDINVPARLVEYFTERQVEVLESLFEGWDYLPKTYAARLISKDSATRLRWIWTYVAKHPRFTVAEIRKAAERYGKA